MKAVVLENFGGPENLKFSDFPDPKPQQGEVLVRVRACALNHLDLWVRGGLPGYKIRFPHILGCDVAGEIAALGPGVSGLKVGARVAVAPGRSCGKCRYCSEGLDNLCAEYGIIGAQGGPGGYAQYLCVGERYILPAPDSFSFEDLAAYPLTYLTAWHMLVTLGGLKPGQSVLVLGAGSGVGVAAIQIAKHFQAKVIAVSTSQQKLDKALKLGADAGICSPPQDIVKEARRLTGGEMIDIAFEHVGLATFESSLKSLKKGGRLVTCGATTGYSIPLDLRYVFSRELKILGDYMGTLGELKTVSELIASGKLKPVIDKIFPLEDARQAHEYMAARKNFGKIVLRVD